MITGREVAKIAPCFAVAFVAWTALGMPFPQYRYLLGGETAVIKREDWRCAAVRMLPDGDWICSRGMRRKD